MLWYATMFNKERNETFESELDITEYLASFINPEGVKQVKESRANRKTVSDEDFEAGIRKMFGRDFNPDILNGPNAVPMVDTDRLSPPPEAPKKPAGISMQDLKRYTGIELDDITFIPNKK